MCANSPRDARDHIYVAFTGADDGVWIVRSDDRGYSWPGRCRLPNELSRSDAGPAIAVHPDGSVAVCWVGTDGS